MCQLNTSISGACFEKEQKSNFRQFWIEVYEVGCCDAKDGMLNAGAAAVRDRDTFAYRLRDGTFSALYCLPSGRGLLPRLLRTACRRNRTHATPRGFGTGNAGLRPAAR